jgi:hypothetical protein
VPGVKLEERRSRLAATGALLREVRPGLLKQTPGVRQRWFQAPGCDLFLWYDASAGLCQVQLTLGTTAVEWKLGGPVRTARLRPFGGLRDKGELSRLEHDALADPQTLSEARALLSEAAVDELTLLLVRRHLGL